MRMRTYLAATGLAGVALCASAASTPSFADPAPGDFQIKSIAFGGTGCPAGTATGYVDASNSTLSLLFDDFVVETGPDVPLAQSRKNCQVNIDIQAPAGYSYAIAGIDQHGYASVAPGARAVISNLYYFTGQLATSSTKTVLTGPVSSDWESDEPAEPEELVWSPCGSERALNINTSLRLSPGSSTEESFITLDAERLDQTFHLVWRQCQ